MLRAVGPNTGVARVMAVSHLLRLASTSEWPHSKSAENVN